MHAYYYYQQHSIGILLRAAATCCDKHAYVCTAGWCPAVLGQLRSAGSAATAEPELDLLTGALSDQTGGQLLCNGKPSPSVIDPAVLHPYYD